MSDYSFEYESLNDKIRDLEYEVNYLKTELVETDNTIYEILNRLDRLEQQTYNTPIVPTETP
jgi:predicted nuclease with TOPRIM domain